MDDIILSKARSFCEYTSGTKDYMTAYDELLWVIVTASTDELINASLQAYESPILDIPRPLQITLVRLAALSTSDVAARSDLLGTLASLCDPMEEEAIVAPLRL